MEEEQGARVLAMGWRQAAMGWRRAAMCWRMGWRRAAEVITLGEINVALGKSGERLVQHADLRGAEGPGRCAWLGREAM